MKKVISSNSNVNIIKKALIHNFFSEIILAVIDKTRLYHLFVLLLGIIYPTQHKSCREIGMTIPGSPDGSNLNDSLRNCPKYFKYILKSSVEQSLYWILKKAKKLTQIFISIDDTLLSKSNKQKSLSYVFYCGHKKQSGIQIIFMHLQVGKYDIVFAYRIYDPNGMKSKHDLARELISELREYLKGFDNITLLADSWYAEEKLIKYVTVECGWNWISGIKSNRTIDGKQVKKSFWWISNTEYEKIKITKKTFMATSKSGYLSGFKDKGLFIVTKIKNKTNHTSQRYFYCSDPNTTVQKALDEYSNRWKIENDFWTLKEHLGIADFRFQGTDTVSSYLNVVVLTYIWLYNIKNKESERIRSDNIKIGVCDVLARLRFNLKEHFIEYGEDSIKVLVDEFLSVYSQRAKLE